MKTTASLFVDILIYNTRQLFLKEIRDICTYRRFTICGFSSESVRQYWSISFLGWIPTQFIGNNASRSIL